MFDICVSVGNVFAIRVIVDCVFGGDALNRIGERYPCVAVRASSLFCPARYKTHVFLQWRTQLGTITLFPPNYFLWDRYYWHGGLEWEVGPHMGQQYHF